MTYRQAHEGGGKVRKGEKGNLVVHAGTFTPKADEADQRPAEGEDGEDRARHYLKRYIVFNVEQIDGLDMTKYPAPQVEIKNRDDRDPELDAAFSRYPVPYRERGNSAYRSEEHTSELQSLMRISYAVFCLKKKHKYT